MWPWFPSCGGLKHGPEETIKRRDDRGQVGQFGPPCTSNECGPLDLLLSIVCELAGQRDRTFAGDLDSPALERRRDCQPQCLAVKRSRFGQPMDVEEILHSTVRQGEP